MRSDRTARRLLRLYPSAWRARYGDEFLALVEDQGLSWRGVLDVVAAAAVERVRSLAATRHDIDSDLAIYTGRDLRDRFAEFLTFMTLVGLATGALIMAGLASPTWQWPYQVFMTWHWSGYRRSSSWSERAVGSFVSLSGAIALAGLAWIAAQAGRSFGSEAWLERWFNIALGTFLTAGVFRGGYLFYRALRFNSRWQGVAQREFRIWRVATFLFVVLVQAVEPDPRSIWFGASFLWMAARPPQFLTPAAAARRRADQERVYGSQGTPPPSQPE